MSRKAILQGEMHVRRGDADNLFERSSDTTEALFIEGRSSDLRIPDYSIPYLAFLIGMIELAIFYETVYKLKNILPFVTQLDFQHTASERGWDIEDEIDADVDQFWDHCSNRVLWIGAGSCAVLILYALLLPFIGNPIFGIPPGLLAVLVVVFTPFLLTAFPIFYLGFYSIRDDIMAENINEAASNNGYTEILILVGDNHVPGVKRELEQRGWEVDPENSGDTSRKLMRMIPTRS